MAGAAPVCTTAGPPTHRIRCPAALTSRICWAICRTCRACGFSLDTTEFMNSKTLSSAVGLGSMTTFTPCEPHTTRSPRRTSLTGTVRTDRVVRRHDQAAVHLRAAARSASDRPAGPG